MPLTYNEQLITIQLENAIKEMYDFLLALGSPNAINLNDEKIYAEHYAKIGKLSIKVRAEGYKGYEHKNPHKTLGEFLKSGKINDFVLKFYSKPVFKREIIKKPIALKAIDGIIKRSIKIVSVFKKSQNR